MVLVTDQKNVLDDMRSRVQQQGDIVRKLKASKASEAELRSAVEELKARKKLLEAKEIELTPLKHPFDRTKLEDLLKQKFFYDQSFAIYGGVQGLYDYGPMGCAMKSNLLSAWRQHFVLEDHLLEVDCSMLTPHAVLQSSGHVDRFTDWMVKDVKTGECFRADHLIKANLESKLNHKKTSASEKDEIRKLLVQLDNMGKDELDDIIRRFSMKSPNDNSLSEAHEFNLMFATLIGPTGQCKGFLRPETAQGIFVNFQRLLQFNQGRIPFGAAQIGSSFRNEISPRSGLIRVREFTMAEIEYFVDPTDKRHPKFAQIRDVVMNFYSACDQMDGKAPRKQTIGEAVDQGMVANETLGYFMARIHQFLLLIGVDENRLRFRQHLSNEMAHYACDCWDAECQTSYGWIECVGCADRSCYDLTQHTKATGARLVAEKRLAEPRQVKVRECVPNKEALGKAFRGDSKLVAQRMSELSLDEKLELSQELASRGQAELKIGEESYTIDQSMVQIRESETTMHVEEFVPNVIEPSFGIGRIMYSIFEHSFRTREGDEQRTYLSLPPILAPYKCSVLPLSTHPDLIPFVQKLSKALTRHGVSHRVDESSGSIGRRYARTDQIAIPYGITVDFDTVNLSPPSATLRERDSMKQIRVPLDELPSLVSDLANDVSTWADAQVKYPSFEQQETVTQTQPPICTEPLPDTKPVDKKAVRSKRGKASAQSAVQETMRSCADPLHATDEWQSVSEDINEFNKKQDQETESWSSATETAGPVSESVSGLAHPIPEKPSSIDKPNTAPKLPRSWAECGVAIQRHYQAYRTKPKPDSEKSRQAPAPAHSAVEVEDVRSSFSGYEADQEDNVASRSATEQRPPASHELDTPYQLSPALQSMDGDKDKPLNLKDSDRQYHGLFVGEGWPSEPPPTKKPQVTAKEKSNKGSTVSNDHRDAIAPVKQPEPTEQSDWPTVLARLTDRGCVPELWQFPSNIDISDNELFSQQCSAHSMGSQRPEKSSDGRVDISTSECAGGALPRPESTEGMSGEKHVTISSLKSLTSIKHEDGEAIQSLPGHFVSEPAALENVHRECEQFLNVEPSQHGQLDTSLDVDDSWQPWQSASDVWQPTGAALQDRSSAMPPASSDHGVVTISREHSIGAHEIHDHEGPGIVIPTHPEPVPSFEEPHNERDGQNVHFAPSVSLSPSSTRNRDHEMDLQDQLLDSSTTIAFKQHDSAKFDAVPADHAPVSDVPTVETTPAELIPTSSAGDPPTLPPSAELEHPSTTNISAEFGNGTVSTLKKSKSKRRKPKKKK